MVKNDNIKKQITELIYNKIIKNRFPIIMPILI